MNERKCHSMLQIQRACAYFQMTDIQKIPFSVVVLGNFRRFFSSLFSFLLPSLDFSFIYNKFLMPFRGFFYWKNFFDML